MADRYAMIANGVVTNSILADAAFAKSQGLVLLPAGAGIGWLYDGKTFTAPSAPAPKLEDYRLAIQTHIDAAAISRRYDSGTSMASYVASTNEAWAAEARVFVAWRDAVWALVYAKLAAVEAGEIKPPAIADLLAELPAIEWPSAEA